MEPGTYAVSFSVGGAVPRTRRCTIVIRDGGFAGDDGEFSYRGTISGDGYRVRAVVQVEESRPDGAAQWMLTLGGIWAMSGFTVHGFADASRTIPVRAVGVRQLPRQRRPAS